jgi:hypothetical protein
MSEAKGVRIRSTAPLLVMAMYDAEFLSFILCFFITLLLFFRDMFCFCENFVVVEWLLRSFILLIFLRWFRLMFFLLCEVLILDAWMILVVRRGSEDPCQETLRNIL